MKLTNFPCLFSLVASSLFSQTYAFPPVRRQAGSSSASTIAGSSCASPSCTVSFDVIPTLVVSPSAATVLPSGAGSPITIDFDPLTTSDITLGSIVLQNTDTSATLTLSSTTLPSLTTTIHTSFAPSESPTQVTALEVVAVIVPQAQEVISDSGATCPIDPIGGESSSVQSKRRSFADSLFKRSNSITGCNTDESNLIQTWFSDARTILNTVVPIMTADDAAYATSNHCFVSRRLTGASYKTYFAPQFFDVVKQMGSQILTALDPNSDVYNIRWLCEAASTAARQKCTETRTLIPFAVNAIDTAHTANCFDSITYLCNTLLQATDLSTKLGDFPNICDIDLVNNWETFSKLGAKTIIHELTHANAIGQAAGVNQGTTRVNGQTTFGTNQGFFSEEFYGRPLASSRTNFAQINNADTYAWFFLERYINAKC
ncbi:hypothetical protein NA57DRAFT_55753 [Rhizodiscina lignyota]|uniref:Lysine-specific metallo-endopeptidase domain-containing protein n=1 Tax=Rhizodiscina lignyota TaxID=1504668 RepID=A0A9P4IJT6_9PEZI|nr:hypothetical protein NA57DRAFT_55753 [Rhizodiscina lignyota]